MILYCVRTITNLPPLSAEEAKLIQDIPHEKNLNNRFPFSDLERKDCEAFFKGNYDESHAYKAALIESLQYLFVIDKVDTEAQELI